MAGENLLGRVLFEVCYGEQKVLSGNVFVLEVGGFFEGLFEQLVGGVRKRGLGCFSGNLGEFFDVAIEIAENCLRTDADFFEDRRNDALFVFKQRGEQVDGQKLRVAVLRSKIVRARCV